MRLLFVKQPNFNITNSLQSIIFSAANELSYDTTVLPLSVVHNKDVEWLKSFDYIVSGLNIASELKGKGLSNLIATHTGCLKDSAFVTFGVYEDCVYIDLLPEILQSLDGAYQEINSWVDRSIRQNLFVPKYSYLNPDFSELGIPLIKTDEIEEPFVFVPLEYSQEIRFLHWGINYVDYIKMIADECALEKLSIVLKPHPLIYRKDAVFIQNIYQECNHRCKTVMSPEESREIMKRAALTVCCDSEPSVIDAAVVGGKVANCMTNLFLKAGTGYYGRNRIVKNGLENEVERINQKKLLWWYYNDFLFHYSGSSVWSRCVIDRTVGLLNRFLQKKKSKNFGFMDEKYSMHMLSDKISSITIKRGDSLSSLFGEFWFAVYWLPENKQFRQQNPDPNTIRAGSVIFCPIDLAQRE